MAGEPPERHRIPFAAFEEAARHGLTLCRGAGAADAERAEARLAHGGPRAKAQGGGHRNIGTARQVPCGEPGSRPLLAQEVSQPFGEIPLARRERRGAARAALRDALDSLA